MKEIEELLKNLVIELTLFPNTHFCTMKEDTLRQQILSRFAELEKYKTAFEPLWEYCVGERKNKIALELKIAEQEKYENDTGDLISKIADRDDEIKKLEEQVERIKEIVASKDGDFRDKFFKITDIIGVNNGG